jgi:hypothetical protein
VLLFLIGGFTLSASRGVGQPLVASAPAGCATITADNSDDCVRLNQVQVLGTHNSYHLAPKAAVLEAMSPERRQGLEYTHRTLTEQLSELGVRQFEIDVFADPEGGRYASPSAYKLTGDTKNPVMEKPGFKVLHVQDLDVRSTCPTLVACLTEIKAWSTANPGHLPVMIMIEAKDTPIENRPNFEFVKPHPIGAPELDALDAEIRSVFAADRVITPDSVRGDHATLDEALRKDGWPSLGRARGKVMFALDNTDRKRDEYLRGHPSLKGRMLFVTAPAGDPAVAFIKMNEARGPAEERIREQVKAGYIVRTRADEPTTEARNGSTVRKDSAFRSGAQFVSTDYPEVSPFGSGYIARIPGPSGLIARCNPVSAPAGCRDEWLEPGRVDAKSPASPSTAGRRQ